MCRVYRPAAMSPSGSGESGLTADWAARRLRRLDSAAIGDCKTEKRDTAYLQGDFADHRTDQFRAPQPSVGVVGMRMRCGHDVWPRSWQDKGKSFAVGGELGISFVSCCRPMWLNSRFKSRTSSGCGSMTAPLALLICRIARRSAAFSLHGQTRTSGALHISLPNRVLWRGAMARKSTSARKASTSTSPANPLTICPLRLPQPWNTESPMESWSDMDRQPSS